MISGAWLMKEFHRIEGLDDELEKKKQMELLDEIIDKVNEYDSYLYDYKKSLKLKDMQQRGIELKRADISSKSIKTKWRNVFASGLTKEDKKKIYFSYYMWHIYSFEVKQALVKEKARRAFNRKVKNQVYVFYQNQEEVYFIENARQLKASDFDMNDDVYIVDADMKWTYIHTHEAQCGPYYVKLS